MNQTAQERAGRKHDRAAGKLAAVAEPHACDLSINENKIVGLAFDDREIFLRDKLALHRRRIQLAIRLRAGPAHCRALALVQHAKLDAGGICHAPHQPIERIHLAHEMPFAEAPDRGIARHRTDGRKLVRDERRVRAHACGRRRGF